MTYIVIITIGILTCLQACATDTTSLTKYKLAFDFVVKSKEAKEFSYSVTREHNSIIAVKDTLICLTKNFFIKEVVQDKYGTIIPDMSKEQYDSLRRIEYIKDIHKCDNFSNYAMQELHSLDGDSLGNAQLTLYFSDVDDSFLMAQLVASFDPNGYHTNPLQPLEAVLYLFFFEDDMIKSVHTAKVVQ